MRKPLAETTAIRSRLAYQRTGRARHIPGSSILGELHGCTSLAGICGGGRHPSLPKHLLQSVRPKLEQLAGFRGLYLLRRRGLEAIEFLVLTLWDSMDAVRAFAGDQPDLAVVEPEARAALVRFDNTVNHYEVLATPDAAG